MIELLINANNKYYANNNSFSPYLQKRITQLIDIFSTNANNKLSEIQKNTSTFNIKWNERYGNDLGSAALSFEINSCSNTLNIIHLLIDIIINAEELTTKGMEHDEVNIYHLMLGLFLADKHITLEKRDITNDLYERVLSKSYKNETSNWYTNNCRLHNHVFHILCLRLVCLTYLKEKINKNIEAEINDLRVQFSENLKIITNLYNGVTNESASYLSYSFTSIANILLLEKTFHNRNYSFSTTNLFRYIDHTFFPENCYAFNFSDAPFNWSYSPENWIRFLHDYDSTGQASLLIEKIENSRLNYYYSKEINRNQHAFLYLSLANALNSNNKTKKDHDDPNYESNFDSVGIHCLRRGKIKIVIHYGKPGGKFIQNFAGKNFGHDYPSIGTVAISINSNLVTTNPLYLKPKSPYLASAAVYHQSDATITPVGIYSINDLQQFPNWLDSKKNRRWSELDFVSLNSLSFYIISIKEDRHICHTRAITIVNNSTLFIIDIIKTAAPTKTEIIFTNSINKYTQDMDLIVNNDIFIHNHSNNNLIRAIKNQTLNCHEFKYNLSTLNIINLNDTTNHVVVTEFTQNQNQSDVKITKDDIRINSLSIKISNLIGDQQ